MNAADAFDPVSFVRRWGEAMQLAPNTLVQAILPGWNLTLNAFNSSAPHTELAVLKAHSYGRQLGRINEVLRELVARADPAGEVECFEEFRRMLESIDRIKDEALDQRVDKLIGDLRALREADGARHERLVRRLREGLGRD